MPMSRRLPQDWGRLRTSCLGCSDSSSSVFPPSLLKNRIVSPGKSIYSN